MAVSSCSYEPRRVTAYSEDLRWRSSQSRRWSCNSLAHGVPFRNTGGVQKKNYPRDKAFSKLTPALEYAIIHLVLKRPGVLLREIQTELVQEYGAELSLSTICMFLHKTGFTRQKLRVAAPQHDDFLRFQFVSDVSIYDPETLVFLDETGSDRRTCIRRYGYSLRGKPLVTHKLLVRGERISAIAFMSVNGMLLLDCKTVKQTVNGDVFYDFVQATLLPHLMPFNGKN